MSRLVIALLVLVGCTARGSNREGAVAVTAYLALRPAADGEPWVRDIVDAIANEQADQAELTAEGKRATPTVPHITVTPNPIYSDHLPPIPAVTIRAADREALEQAHARALARARAGSNDAGDVVAIFAKDGGGWQLHFVHVLQGFELAPGAMAKIREPDAQESNRGITIFLADEDAPRFEQLTRDHLEHRVALVSGSEALMIPVVRDVIPGGELFITPGDEPADELLARLVR